MSSETITRNDLTNILNEIGIGAIPFGTNHTYQLKDISSTAITVSNTTPQKVFSISHNSKTGQILCIGRLYLQTSAYTSRGRLFIDENNVDTVNTNATTDKEMILFSVANVAEGTHEISLRVSTQNTSCTGTIPAYRTLGLLAVDLTKEMYVGGEMPPTTQGTFTRSVGSSDNITVKQYGNVVYVGGYILGATTTTSEMKIGDISNVSIPTQSTRGTCVVSTQAYEMGTVSYLTITNIGEVRIKTSNSGSSKAIYFNETYIV